MCCERHPGRPATYENTRTWRVFEDVLGPRGDFASIKQPRRGIAKARAGYQVRSKVSDRAARRSCRPGRHATYENTRAWRVFQNVLVPIGEFASINLSKRGIANATLSQLSYRPTYVRSLARDCARANRVPGVPIWRPGLSPAPLAAAQSPPPAPHGASPTAHPATHRDPAAPPATAARRARHPAIR